MGTIDIIIVVAIAYLGVGVFLSYELFNSYGGNHQDEKMAAMIFFWPIIFAGAIIVLCFLAIFTAFKGLYFMVRDFVKEEET